MYQVSAMPNISSKSRINDLTKVVRVHFHLLKRSFLRNSMWWILAIMSVIIFIGLYIASFSLINNVIASICAQIYDKYVLSSVIYAVTLFLCISLIRDYLSGNFKWANHQRAVFIIIPVTGFTVAYAFFERTDALLGNIILISTYLLYACFIKNAGESGISPKPHDQLYRSRLFNRTHQHIRKLAKSTPHGLTIGICGQWGSGKTFFIDTLLTLLSRPVNLDLRNSEQWNEKFIICKKVELWSASSLDDAWNRIIHALHIGIFNRPPFCNAKAKKLLSFLTALSSNQTAAHELIELILPEFEDIHIQSIVNKMKEHKVVLVIDDLERADFSIIQAMLPLFERLKKLPNLIVICAVAEDELKQVFLRERVLPDFVQGHLAKLFDLRVEIPTLPYTAIENFQDNLFIEKYKDCPMVKSFLTKYPLRFDSARQMIRVIDRLTSIERQYYANCPFSFEREPKDEQNSILAKAKYIFLIETLRLVSPTLLKELYEKLHYSNTLNKIPYTLLATSAYDITEDAHERYDLTHGDSDNNKRKIENEVEWAEINKKLYKALIQKATEWSIFSYLYEDVYAESVTDQHKRESDFRSAYSAYYTRCTSLLEWEIQQISENQEMQGIPYHEKVSIHFKKLNEHPEPKFVGAAEFSLFDYEIRQAKGNNEKIKQVISSLQKESREIGNIYGNEHLNSMYFLRTISYLGYSPEDKDFDYHSHEPLFFELYKVMNLREQAHVLTPFFHRYKTKSTKKEHTDLAKYADWLSQQPDYQKLVKKLCYEYGKNLAYHINYYPDSMPSILQEFHCQAYVYAKGTPYHEQIQSGINDYIQSCSNINKFIYGWIDFMGHCYKDSTLNMEEHYTFVSEAVYEMMTHIHNLIYKSADSFDKCDSAHLSKICERTLSKLRYDLQQWLDGSRKDKEEYTSGLQNLIQMIEKIQQSAA